MKNNRLLSLLLCGILAFAFLTPALAQKSTLMTFTSIKGAGAKKDWVADTCYASMNAQKTLTITGLYPTGRTDFPYQQMVITVKTFTTLSSTIAYQISDAYLEDIFNRNGKPTLVKTTMVKATQQAYIVDYDQEKGLLKGTFFFKMTSHPTTAGDLDFVTDVTVGKFEARIESGITLEAAPTKTVQINDGNKVNYKIYAKNLFGQAVSNADVHVTDELAKTKDVKVGVTSGAGEYVYTVDIPKKTNAKQYKVSYQVKKTTPSGLDTSNTVERILDVSGRYWVYSCASFPIMTFDAGDGNEWKSDDPLPTITAKGKIVINEILTCEGTVTIDPRAGQERVSGQYEMYIDGVQIADSKTKLTLHNGIGMAMNCGKFMKWDTPGVIKKKIGGYEFTLDEVSFADLNFAKTVKLKGSVQWNNLNKDNCTTNSNQPENSSLSIGMIIGYEELGGFKIEALEASITNFSTKFTPGFCIDNAGFSYDPVKDAFTVSTALEYSTPNPADANKKLFEGKAKGSLTWVNGRFDAFMFEGKVKPGMIIPDVPFTWNGLKIAASGIAKVGSWAGFKAEVSGFFNSDDQLFKDKFPLLGKILGTDPFCEVELNGKYEFTGPKITATATGRFMAVKTISVTKKWQIELSSSAVLDVTKKVFEFGECTLKAFHFGMDDFFLQTITPPRIHLSFGGPDMQMYASTMSVTVRLPDYPSDPVNSEKWGKMFEVLQYLKFRKILPRTLGAASVSYKVNNIDGVQVSGMVDVTTCGIPLIASYGSLSVKMGLNDAGPYMNFGGAFSSLILPQGRAKGEQIQSKSVSEQSVQAAALDTFTVSDNVKRAFILLTSKSKVPVSALISPSGEKITATKSDSTIILFNDGAATFAQWSIIAPEKGKWILELTNPAATDSVTVFALNKDRAFDITAAAAGKNVTVNWDGSNYDPSDYVDVYVDTKLNAFSGIYVGRALASAGKYTFPLSENLEKCSYYVYAQREAAGSAPATVYAAGQFTVDKSSALAPKNIVVTANQFGATKVNFTVNSDPNVYQYAAYIAMPDGTDSLLARAYPEESTMEFTCDTALLKSLYIVTITTSGVKSCPGIPQSVTVGVDDDNAQAGLSVTAPLVVVPNPTSANASIRFALPQSGAARIIITDVLGRVVSEIPTGMLSAGDHSFSCNTSGFGAGAYNVLVVSGSIRYSTTMTVIR